MRKQNLKKLSLNKFQISKIDNTKSIVGGNGDEGGGVLTPFTKKPVKIGGK